MIEKRKTASFLIRVWQEPSEWQPPGEWRISARPLEGGSEMLFKSPVELWRYLTDHEASARVGNSAKVTTLKEKKKNEK